MPGFDGTGPRGQGPLTGGGFGFCAPGRGFRGYGRGFAGRGMGRGLGRGFSRDIGMGGRWRRVAYFDDMDYGDEKTLLKEDIQYLEDKIQYLQQVKSQLEKQQAQSEK